MTPIRKPTTAQQKILDRMAIEGRVLTVSRFDTRWYNWGILRVDEDGTLDGSESYHVGHVRAGTAAALVDHGYVVFDGERRMGQFTRLTYRIADR